jgi:hypothetical protein
MRARALLFLFLLTIVVLGSILFVSSCGTKEDENTPTDTRYTCDGTPDQCLRIGSGWTLDVKICDDVIVDPSVVALSDGRFRVYGNVGYSGGSVTYPRHVESLISTDGGVTFTLEGGKRIVGDADHDAFGPLVFALPNGDFRMYLTDQRTVVGTVGATAIISAISRDGLNFTCEPGERLHYTGTGDEAYGIRGGQVVALPDGTYRMYYAGFSGATSADLGGKLLSAVSKDGLKFTRESGVRAQPQTLCPAAGVHGVNGKVYLDQGGTYHLFWAGAACDDVNHTNEKIGIFHATSTDGLTFSFSKAPVVQGYYIKSQYNGNPTDPFINAEDPMVVLTPAGLRMYFACGTVGSADVRYYSVYNPTLH